MDDNKPSFPKDPLADLRELSKTSSERLKEMIDSSSIEELRRAEAFRSADLMKDFRLFVNNFERSFATYQNNIAAVAQAALKPLANIVKFEQELSAHIKKTYVDPFEQVRGSVSSFLNQYNEFGSALAQFAENFERKWTVAEKKLFRLFGELGFAGLESHLTGEQLALMMDKYEKAGKKKGKQAIVNLVIRIFKANEFGLLNDLVKKWSTVPYLKRRQKIVNQAIAAHKERKYELSIPTLLPLIDGLATELMASQPVVTPKKKKQTMFVKEVVTIHAQEDGEIYSECVVQIVNTLIYRYYDFKTMKRSPNSINRHAILHGQVIGYGTEANSYKVILLLDFLAEMYKQKEQKKLAVSVAVGT